MVSVIKKVYLPANESNKRKTNKFQLQTLVELVTKVVIVETTVINAKSGAAEPLVLLYRLEELSLMMGIFTVL